MNTIAPPSRTPAEGDNSKRRVRAEIGSKMMRARIFVGNVKFTVSDDTLRKAFMEVGPVVRAEIVRDQYDGRSRGFAFVEMALDTDVQRAVQELSGKLLAGRPMRVEAATTQRPKLERARAAA